jgi:hypothetical protein
MDGRIVHADLSRGDDGFAVVELGDTGAQKLVQKRRTKTFPQGLKPTSILVF